MNLIPTMPLILPSTATVLQWFPLGKNQGIVMTANIAPRGAGHSLNYRISVERRYENGEKVCGTANRVDMKITVGVVPEKGFIACLQMADTTNLVIQGDEGFHTALERVSDKIVPYAKTLMPRTLAGKNAVCYALIAPTGGLLCLL